MSQESKRTYTIRLPETVAARVEKQAASSGIPPTTLIQSLVVDTCIRLAETAVGPAPNLISKLDAISKTFERLEQNSAERYTRLLFEVVKTRSVFLHALDQSLSEPVVDEIIEASEKTARDYIDRLRGEGGIKQ
jgi:capsid portal protein